MNKKSDPHWIEHSIKPANKGKFSAEAKRAGKTTAEFAKEKDDAPGVEGKRARWAEAMERVRPKSKRS